MSRPRVKICVACLFYSSYDRLTTARMGGNCKRYPTPVKKVDKDWCGEFVKKQVKNKQDLKQSAT